jgi:hypothetical protein
MSERDKRNSVPLSRRVVKRIGVVACVVLVCACSSDRQPKPPSIDPSSISRAGTSSLVADGSGFRVAYAPTDDPAHDQIRQLFAGDRVFEKIADALDRVLVMPRAVDIHMVGCGQPNAFYDPQNHRIIVCYELITYFLDTFRPHVSGEEELGNAAMGATFFAFFHELGHAVIAELEIPATGREEDSADQIATLILLEAGDHGVAMAMSGAKWFALLADDNQHRTPFWDEHALDGQRFYNVVCLIYGEKPDERAALVRDRILPEPRAARCPAEYASTNRSWEKLMAPHLRDAAR